MTWVESVRQQLADEGIPFGTTVTVSDGGAAGSARIHLYTESPLCETFLELREGHPNVERVYDDAKRQHARSVANLGGKS